MVEHGDGFHTIARANSAQNKMTADDATERSVAPRQLVYHGIAMYLSIVEGSPALSCSMLQFSIIQCSMLWHAGARTEEVVFITSLDYSTPCRAAIC